MRFRTGLLFGALVSLVSCRPTPAYDLVIRHGTVYDGTGGEPAVGDVAVLGDSIVAVGDLGGARGRVEVDATGLAVAPGFINMLSWANEDLLVDGRSQGDIRQGVTLEIFGEGESMGPLHRLDARRDDRRGRATSSSMCPGPPSASYLDHVVSRGHRAERRFLRRCHDGPGP